MANKPTFPTRHTADLGGKNVTVGYSYRGMAYTNEEAEVMFKGYTQDLEDHYDRMLRHNEELINKLEEKLDACTEASRDVPSNGRYGNLEEVGEPKDIKIDGLVRELPNDRDVFAGWYVDEVGGRSLMFQFRSPDHKTTLRLSLESAQAVVKLLSELGALTEMGTTYHELVTDRLVPLDGKHRWQWTIKDIDKTGQRVEEADQKRRDLENAIKALNGD